MSKSVGHNWTKKTLGACAMVHLEQMIYAMRSHADKKQGRKEIKRLLKHYEQVERSLR